MRGDLADSAHSMHLMYIPDASGKRVYTLKKVLDGAVSKSAHPARFSPDDKYSRSVTTDHMAGYLGVAIYGRTCGSARS